MMTEVDAGPEMSGALIHEHVRVLKEELGEEAFARAVASLSDPQRKELAENTAVGWFRIATFEALYRACAQELGIDVVRLHERCSRKAIESTFTSFWRLLLSLTTTSYILSRAPRIFAKGYNRGGLVVESISDNEALVRVVDWDTMPTFARRGLRIAIEALLGLTGKTQAKVHYDPRAPTAVYRVSGIRG